MTAPAADRTLLYNAPRCGSRAKGRAAPDRSYYVPCVALVLSAGGGGFPSPWKGNASSDRIEVRIYSWAILAGRRSEHTAPPCSPGPTLTVPPKSLTIPCATARPKPT